MVIRMNSSHLTGSQPSSNSSRRLFQNPFLESLSHVHPSVPFIIWIPVVFYCVLQAFQSDLSLTAILGYSTLGLIFWTLTEYVMHRFVFHFSATTQAGKYLVFLFHGIHHDEPQDSTRLVMPPVVSITLATAFFFLFRAVLGTEVTWPFFATFMAGYLVYDFIHFSVHHFKPKTAWGHRLKDNHMRHHFVDHDAKWGVSSPLWDYIFGSFQQPPAKKH
jgi:sterol desaturase/sphingolipid hydroxylase (fatty acid hydroxylase superfamily)